MSYSESDLSSLLRNNPDLALMGDGSIDRIAAKVDARMRENLGTVKLSEHDLQVALISECDRRATFHPEWGLLFAIPNGQYRQGQRMEPGLRPGVPDLFLPIMRRGYGGLFIELKVTPNKPSRVQLEWVRILQERGYFCKVVWDSVDEVLGLIDWYLGERG